MTRQLVGALLLVVLVGAAGDRAWAQSVQAPAEESQIAALADGKLHGTVVDDMGEPLSGVVVSAMGMTTVFQVTDDMGRFMFRGLPIGSYLVRAHLKDYAPAWAREVQVTANSRALSDFVLEPHDSAVDPKIPAVLAAGLGPASPVEDASAPAEDVAPVENQRVWRLRHLRRSVLKDIDPGLMLAGASDSFSDDMWSGFGRAIIGAPVRLATALFSDPAVSAEINFLTTTSFNRPQDLFSGQTVLPRGVAYIAFEVPDEAAVWSVQGALTQGNLTSWILAGSYSNRTEGAHQFEVGMSYGMQRYTGGNSDALASVGNLSRNSGVVHGSDRWSLGSHVELNYGARFAVYDYLPSSHGLLSPRASLIFSPIHGDSLQVRAAVSRDMVAPGAVEFLPPSTGLLLPPERTFSVLVPGTGFTPEQVNHVELGVQREIPGTLVVGMRAFRQSVSDQAMTMFGAEGPGADEALGHYYIGSAGDFDASGVGVSVSRVLLGGLRGTVDYTVTDAAWIRRGVTVPWVTDMLIRPDMERVHDITTSVEGEVSLTDTRVFLVYKLNTGLMLPGTNTGSPLGRRFDFRVNQALPFLDFTSAEWEILVAVRNLFHDAMTDMSVFDEVLVMDPPKQIVGGLTIRF
jgi:hypothetical protein